MALVCPNGHRNDDANRFCDQCGAPLSPAPESVSVAAAPTTASSSSGTACPVCGQENVPGTAFCDNCGAALPPPLPAATADTAVADQPATIGGSVDTTSSAAGGALTCPQCGTSNDASNRFCDNCGASLTDASQPATADTGDVLGVAPTTTPPDDAANVPVVDLIGSTPLPTEGTTVPVTPDLAADAVLGLPSSQPVDTGVSASTAQPVDTAVSASSTAPAVDVDAERQRLEETITTQRRMVEQLEQMQQQFGAATPPSILQGLDEARATLAQSESELQALPTAAPQPDPAEVARLEETITTQRRMVEQLEQMQQQFGAATPPSILQGLDEARASLAQSEAELQALTGQSSSQGGSGMLGKVVTAAAVATVAAAAAAAVGAARSATTTSETEAVPAVDSTIAGTTAQTYESPAPSVVPVQPVPVAPVQPVAPAQVVSTPPVQATPVPAVDPITPPPPVMPAVPAPVQPRGTDQLPPAVSQPQTGGPRLVARDGKQIPLPRGGNDVIVGREDPISGIHPEVDLTPHGGETGGVSRRHAVLREQNGQWSVTDLDSTNYTRVDGTRIAPNTPTPLQNGARVQFGRVELEFFMA